MTDKTSPAKHSDLDNKATATSDKNVSVTFSSETSTPQKIDKSSTSKNTKTDKSSMKDTKKSTVKHNAVSPHKTTTNKSSNNVLPILLSLIAIIGLAGLFYWFQLQQEVLSNQIQTQNIQTLKNNENSLRHVESLLQKQQTLVNKNINKKIVDLAQVHTNEIASLKNQVSRLNQNQPSDWLLHEAEYLIRIAARTIWLERDTKAAISLLKDANQRLKELNDPQFLPVRKIIHNDIEALKLLPVLDTQEIILTLMSLNNQINKLPLAMVSIPDAVDNTVTFELSDNANDWQSNLEKTWKKFLKDFITVSRRTANVEPLISPQFQQNLRENLSLKLQMAQWAAKEENTNIYQATLVDIQTWIQDYFDLKDPRNINFNVSIQQLKNRRVSFTYPQSLDSLQAVRKLLTRKNLLLNIPTNKVSPDQNDENIQKNNETLKVPETVAPIHSQPIVPPQKPDNKNEDA